MIGTTYPFWQRHRSTRSQAFPRLHVVLAARGNTCSKTASRCSPST